MRMRFSALQPHELPAMGSRKAVEDGPRFEPPKLLRDMAAKGESFYTRFAPGKKAA